MIRILSKNGYSDLEVIVCGERICTMKCFFCYYNNTFNKIINDYKFNGCIELFEKCSKEGFYYLESYYSGEIINLNENNVIDIIIICICYNEEGLLNDCIKFINNNMNEKILKEIIMNKEFFYDKNMNYINEKCKNYVSINGFMILMNESILYYLSFNNEITKRCINLYIKWM